MKKTYYSLLGLFVMFFITSSTIKSPEAKKRLFEKIIFVELTANKDSVLFQPYSAAWDEGWNLSDDISIHGTKLMNSDKYQLSFNNRKENLFTLLHPLIINGTIQSYFTCDPEAFGLGHSDEGELLYPMGNKEENETFLTSKEARENLCYSLGKFGPESDIPLVDEYGDYVLVTWADGTQSYKYPPRDYQWHTDKDIVKYKLRVSVLINKKGQEKKRVIKAICPIVHRISNDGANKGEIVGEDELLWLNFEELESTLKGTHYLKYLQGKVKSASLK